MLVTIYSKNGNTINVQCKEFRTLINSFELVNVDHIPHDLMLCQNLTENSFIVDSCNINSMEIKDS